MIKNFGTRFSRPEFRKTTGAGMGSVLDGSQIEPGGLTKLSGWYYLYGQGGNIGGKRSLVTYISYDFDRWSDAVAIGLRRDQPPHRQAEELHAGEQVRLGRLFGIEAMSF